MAFRARHILYFVVFTLVVFLLVGILGRTGIDPEKIKDDRAQPFLNPSLSRISVQTSPHQDTKKDKSAEDPRLAQPQSGRAGIDKTAKSKEDPRFSLPRPLADEMLLFERRAYQKLLDGFHESTLLDDRQGGLVYQCHHPSTKKDGEWYAANCKPLFGQSGDSQDPLFHAGGGHFQDLSVALPISDALVQPSNGHGQAKKYFVGPGSIKERAKDFIVYSIGNAGESEFEDQMSRLGADVYSFDCTVSGDPSWKERFSFYPWCIGTKGSMENNFYSHRHGNNSNNNTHNSEGGYIFHTLAETLHLLNHSRLDMLKMDIEGFEWGVLTNEILQPMEAGLILPDQLLFELHTEGASEGYVPKRLTQGQRRHQVTGLMLQLFKKGYRLVHQELNSGDPYCIELTLVRSPLL